jgi:hypothetical protein
MKSFSTITMLLLLIAGCQQESNPTQQNTQFDPTVGKQIPLEVANRWLALYAGQGRTAEATTYKVTSETFSALQSVPDKTGFAFQHALDEAGTHHILIIPVGKDNVQYDYADILDANSNTVVSNSDANNWIQKYQNANPGKIWYHYFGADIFEEIASYDYTHFDIEPAVNDEGSPQLLLFVWPNTANGRVKDADPIVVDASSQCPPCPK